MKQPDQEQEVQRYYDRNTGRFLRLARSWQPRAIHQPLYAEAGMSLEDALHTPHRMILEYMPHAEPVKVLDLGCGVGESVLFLSEKTKSTVQFHGITLSGEQVAMARIYVARSRAEDRIRIHHGSFQSLPEAIPQVHLAYAIESLVHSTDAHQFFAQVASRLVPGGQLVIFDDFIVEGTEEADRVLQDFRSGWLAMTTLSARMVIRIAEESGLALQDSQDLSGVLRLNRPRDKFVRLIAPVARVFMHWSMYCRFLVGGNARQEAYRRGMLEYRILRFEKR